MTPDREGTEWESTRGAAGGSRRLLRWASRLVPSDRRLEWLEERDAELWALWKRGCAPTRLVRFGLDGVTDALRERRAGGGFLRETWDDLRHALRGLRRSPGVVGVTVVVLAVGVGANTAIFSVLHAALLRSSGYPAPERMVMVDLTVTSPETGEENGLPLSWPAYEVAAATVAEQLELAGFTARDMTLLGAGDPARIQVELVTPSYFEVLGADAVVGRALAVSEAPPAQAPVVVLSHGLWSTRFGGDPAVLGRTVRLNGASVRVVGVMPRGFTGLTGTAQAWVSMALAPIVMDPARLTRPRSYWMYAVGRRLPGVSPDGAAAATRAAGRTVARAIPNEGVELGLRIVPFLEARVNPTARLSILVVGVAAGLLLLIACANVAGLLVARGASRRAEMAVRVALGAGRLRLLRIHLSEAVVLAVLGGAGGIGAALLGVRVLAGVLPHAVGMVGANRLQFLDPATIGVNGPVLLFGLAATTLTGLLSGAWPAVRASRMAVRPALARVRSATASGTDRWSGRGLLVAGQLALAVVLLSGAGLMLGSLARLQAVDLGVDGRDLVLARYEIPRGASDDEVVAFHGGLEETLETVPGVRAATLAQCTPLSGRCDVTLAARLDETGSASEDGVPATVVLVGDDYFRVLGIPVLRGRTFDAEDRASSPLSVVLSEEATRRLLPGRDALQERIVASLGPLAREPGGRVVGVVGNVRYDETLAGDTRPAVYVSYRQLPVGYMTVVASSGSGLEILPPLRRAVATLRPDVPLFDATTLEGQIAGVTARTRVVLFLLVVFAGTALLLAGLGIYGLTSYLVARRTRELGVRKAVGATSRQLLGRVVLGAGALGAGGLAVGLLGAVWLTRLMEGLLFGIRPNDPRILAAVSVLLLAAVLVAALVPGWRAARVDPVSALRME